MNEQHVCFNASMLGPNAHNYGDKLVSKLHHEEAHVHTDAAGKPSRLDRICRDLIFEVGLEVSRVGYFIIISLINVPLLTACLKLGLCWLVGAETMVAL